MWGSGGPLTFYWNTQYLGLRLASFAAWKAHAEWAAVWSREASCQNRRGKRDLDQIILKASIFPLKLPSWQTPATNPSKGKSSTPHLHTVSLWWAWREILGEAVKISIHHRFVNKTKKSTGLLNVSFTWCKSLPTTDPKKHVPKGMKVRILHNDRHVLWSYPTQKNQNKNSTIHHQINHQRSDIPML